MHSYTIALARKSTQTSVRKFEISILVGTAIKALKQAAEMKHN